MECGRSMIIARIKLWLLGIGAFLAALGAAYIRGQQAKADQLIKKELEQYKDTRERIDEAATTKRDADDAREWLRNRNK